MCPVVDIVCSEDSNEGYESGEEDYGFIGTRSWLESTKCLRSATELYRRFVSYFLVTNYALDWKASWSKKRVIIIQL